jgi:hypothetical protein
MIDFEGEELYQGEGLEPTPASLGHWLEEQFLGDNRFDSIELLEPGPLPGEAVRVKFLYDEATYFFVSVLEDDSVIRIGLASESREISVSIEAAVRENGESLTEFLEIAIDAEDELEHEVQHFHDDVYYFCSNIPYQRVEEFGSTILRDEIIYYLDGFMNAFYDLLEPGEA